MRKAVFLVRFVSFLANKGNLRKGIWRPELLLVTVKRVGPFRSLKNAPESRKKERKSFVPEELMSSGGGGVR